MKQEHGTSDTDSKAPRPQVPWLEWVASGIGLMMVIGIFSAIGWQAFDSAGTPPAITVEVETVAPVEGGYRVLFRARNSTGEAAAQVEIEGRVTTAGAGDETSRAVLDYIPGHSTRRGGLFFTHDPQTGKLAVRATGFAEP